LKLHDDGFMIELGMSERADIDRFRGDEE